ncbi:hypothetical protein MMC13_005863 [Lambiella insularis]|nr:hypothetical protein [Lambiella insularis]
MSWQRAADYGQQPPPPSQMSPPPPPPYGPPPSIHLYQFGSHDRPQDDHSAGLYRPQEFSFRPINDAPQFPPEADSYRPSRIGRYELRPGTTQNAPRNFQSSNGKGPSQGPSKGLSNFRQRQTRRPQNGKFGRHHATFERPLLQLKRDSTPERMLGTNGHGQVERRFLDIDDMSDSAEEAMEESDRDEYESAPNITETSRGDVSGVQDEVAAREEERTGELTVNTAPQHSTVSHPSASKWSNPEYYTALPPPDESQRKKRDVVKLIRKARVAVEKVTNASNQAATNDDFISFGIEEEQLGVDEDESRGQGYLSLDSDEPGPSARHRRSIHDQACYGVGVLHAPGTEVEALSAASLGPPPGKLVEPSTDIGHTAAGALSGNSKRKRLIEPVETGHFRAPKRKKGPAAFSNGYVLEEWMSPKPANPIPWISRDHRSTEQAGFRLHKEIVDFYEFVKPQEFEHVVRLELLSRLQDVIQGFRTDLELHSFGSFAAGLYLPNADMDLVVLSKSFRNGGFPDVCQQPKQMHQLVAYLVNKNICEAWSIEVIPRAKVPLIKFVDRITNLRVDMSFENDTGIEANKTFVLWKSMYPAMPIIVTIIKQFLMMRGLNEVVNGGLGGFSVTCLVVSLLQNMLRVQTGEIVPERNLGEILLEFLDLYGNQLDISRTGIRMNPPGYVDKRHLNLLQRSKPDRLAIIDPNKPDNDISGGSRNVMLIFARFSRAREELLDAMNSPNRASLLDWMLGGNYDTFMWQRAHLRKLYIQKWGEEDPVDVGSRITTQLQNAVAFPRDNKGSQRLEHGLVSSVHDLAASGLPVTEELTIMTKCILKAPYKRAKPRGRALGKVKKELEQAKVNLKAARDAQHALLQSVGKDIATKPKNWKSLRRQAHDLAQNWDDKVSQLKRELKGQRAAANDIDVSRLSLTAQNSNSPNIANTAMSNDKIEHVTPSQSFSVLEHGLEGFNSRAPYLSVTWHAEFRAFQFRKQFPNVENVPLQLDPTAYRDLVISQLPPESNLRKPHKIMKVLKRRHAIEQANASNRPATVRPRPMGTLPALGTSHADAIVID